MFAFWMRSASLALRLEVFLVVNNSTGTSLMSVIECLEEFESMLKVLGKEKKNAGKRRMGCSRPSKYFQNLFFLTILIPAKPCIIVT